MLNGSGENQHPCCVPEFSGAAFSFSLLSIMLAVGLFYYVPSVHSLVRVFFFLSKMDVEFYQMSFLCPLR